MSAGYGTDTAVRHLRDSDPQLRRLVDSVGPCTLAAPATTHTHTLFDRLATSIMSQQLSVAAAATITGRLRDKAAGDDHASGHLRPDRVVALTDDELRACGISRPKVAALRDLADAVETGRIPALAELATLFDRLATSIMSQQLSVAAAATITGRLRDKAAGDDHASGHLRPDRVVALTDDELRACGISRPKVAALRDLADAVETGRIPALAELATLSDEDVVAALTTVRGIGRWTVEMLLIFLLGRPDVFPVADVGIRRGFERTLGLEHKATPAEMLEHSARWAPYRSVASWYLWRAVDQTGQPGVR